MNCPLMFIISNHCGRKCLTNLVTSKILAHWYAILNAMIFAINFCNAKERIGALKLRMSNHYWRKCLSKLLHLEWCSVMFTVISDIMAHWYAICNTIIFAFNFSNAIKTNCALMFIISKHIGRKCLSSLLHLERCNVMLNVISDKMAHWYAICNNSIIFAIETNCALFVYHEQSSWKKMSY